jgi:hypothetical protein
MGEGVDDGDDRPTMSMEEAAARVGLDEQSVRRWFDAAEHAGAPVGECERDAQGVRVSGSWRRPYVASVEEWRRRRRGAGEVVPVSPAGPSG